MIKIKKLVADKFKQLKELEITFPARGSFLIEGLNESGKSTLFEAIYFGLFGEALVTEGGRHGSLVDLIDYHSKYAYLELQVEVRERILTISRTINRDAPNQWKLKIGDEEITKNNPVNERLMLELGLDGDALLNSCFVEQKKLEKLEGLTKPEREKSLMKLLNLDRLLELEYKFKVKGEEEKDLQYKQQKLEWVKLRNIDLPKITNEKNKIDFKLEMLNLLKLNQKINDEKNSIKRLFKAITLIQPQKVELEKKVERLEELKKTQNHLEKLSSNLTQIKEQETEIKAIRKQLEELDALSKKIPAKEKLIADILILGKRLARINKLEDNLKLEKENLISLDKELGRVEKVKANIVVEEAKLKQKEEHLNSLRVKENVLTQQLKLINGKEALENWRRAKHTLDAIEMINQKEKEIQAQKAIKEEEKDKTQALYKRKLFVGLGLGIILVMLSLLSGSGIIGIIMWLVTSVVVGVGVIYLKKTRDIISMLGLKLRELENEILRLEGHRQSTKVQTPGEQDETKLVEAEDQLLKLNLPLPEGIHKADTLITDLSAKLEGVIVEEIKENYSKITREIAGLEGAISSSKGIIENYKNESNELQGPKILQDKEKAVLRKDKLTRIINKFKPILEKKAKGSGLVLERERLLGEYNRLKTEVTRDFQDVDKKDQLLQKIAERNSIINNITQEMNTIYTATAQIPRGLTLKDYERLKNKVLGEIKEIQEEMTLKELKDLQSKIDAYRGEISLREKHQKELETQRQKFSQKALKSLKYASVRLQNEAGLLKQKEEIEAKIGYLKTHLDKLSKELQIKDVKIEVAECEKEVMDLEQTLKIRRYAQQILSTARNNMVAKVLPNTIRNMQKILPLLTCARYHDAEITEDYKIKVWDERAMRLCAKNIFSGGTKDQFSLALRIAFAISTLPEERGISPSFIFLDEPLSSFDVERSQALIYLLTQGEIMQAFDQIFVISHSQILDPSLFNYYIKMDNGKITEHNLG